MATVINRTTYEVLYSVNTPDYPVESWLINPDLSGVSGAPEKYWKVVDDSVVEMTQEEKDAVNLALTPPPTCFVSTRICDDAVSFSASWGHISGIICSPDFFGNSITEYKPRLVCDLNVSGTGAQVRILEDDVELGTIDLPDTSGSWQTFKSYFEVTLSAGTHRYTIEGQLNGASSAQIRYGSLALIHVRQL